MSGVYIKGMTMPTSCRACMYSRTDITNTDWCVLTEKDLPCDCPLIQVPEHGRLIDAEPIRTFITNGLNSGEFGYDQIKVLAEIEYAPTIIPAEDLVKNTGKSQGSHEITNADRIRAMTDEELTDWYFDKFFPCVPYYSMLQDGCPEHDDCKICLLEWLKQAAGKDGVNDV